MLSNKGGREYWGDGGPGSRDPSLDGLRGWAALSVCLYHFVWELFGIRFPEFRNVFTAIFFDGGLAVSVFFLLSGFVLTTGQWNHADLSPTLKQLAKRYPRLTVPIAAATALTLVLMVCGFAGHVPEAGRIVWREDWLGRWVQFDPSAGDAALYAFASVYWPGHIKTNYNVFLWTMPYELFGSIAVLLICLLRRQLGSPLMLLALLAGVMLASGDYWAIGAGFPLGAAVAIVHGEGKIVAGRSWWPVVAGFVAIVAAAIVQWHSMALWMLELCALAVFIACLSSERARRVLNHPISQKLGTLSFPVYLMQFPVMISLSAVLIVGSEASGSLDAWRAIIIAFVSLFACYLLAMPFQAVDALTARFNRVLTRTIWRQRAPTA